MIFGATAAGSDLIGFNLASVWGRVFLQLTPTPVFNEHLSKTEATKRKTEAKIAFQLRNIISGRQFYLSPRSNFRWAEVTLFLLRMCT